MLNRFDWKFILALLFTVASIVVPIWLWQADLSSKALTLTIQSVVEIQPQGVGPLEGIQMFIDEKLLSTPSVSVLELSNTGSRPIVAADFEGPLKITVASPSEIRKVRFGSFRSTTSLEPKINLIEGVVFIQPLLLNPSDVIRLNLVTANARPEYSIHGRIAGVAEITINDAQSTHMLKRYWLKKAITILLLVIYIVNIMEFAYMGIQKRSFMPWALATGLVTGLGGILLSVLQFPWEQTSMSTFSPIVAIVVLISVPILLFRMRQRNAS